LSTKRKNFFAYAKPNAECLATLNLCSGFFIAGLATSGRFLLPGFILNDFGQSLPDRLKFPGTAADTGSEANKAYLQVMTVGDTKR